MAIIETRGVLASGQKALVELDSKTVQLAEDMYEGTLFGLDANGKAVKASTVAGSVVKAIGIIKEGGVREWGEGFVTDPNRVAKAGTYITINPFHRMAVEEGKFTIADVASQKPLYQGDAGTIVDVAPVGTGKLKKVVGYVIGQSTVFIDLTRDFGTILA